MKKLSESNNDLIKLNNIQNIVRFNLTSHIVTHKFYSTGEAVSISSIQLVRQFQ